MEVANRAWSARPHGGAMAEWLKAPDLKSGVPARVSRVRIPLAPPPFDDDNLHTSACAHAPRKTRGRGLHATIHATTSPRDPVADVVDVSAVALSFVRRPRRLPAVASQDCQANDHPDGDGRSSWCRAAIGVCQKDASKRANASRSGGTSSGGRAIVVDDRAVAAGMRCCCSRNGGRLS